LTEAETKILRAAGEFICQYDWNWWCTLTFRRTPTWERADSAFRRWMNTLNRKTFGRNYYRRPGDGLRWLRGVEFQQRDAIHFHVLVAGDLKVHREKAVKLWRKLAGDAQITVYDSTRGAAYYLVKKYATDGNLDFGGVWLHLPFQLSGVVRRPGQGS